MKAPTPTRQKLSPALVLYMAADLAGALLFVTGVVWFLLGRSLFFEAYPSSQMEAGIAVAGGLVLMIWSAPRVRRKLAANRDDTPGSSGRP